MSNIFTPSSSYITSITKELFIAGNFNSEYRWHEDLLYYIDIEDTIYIPYQLDCKSSTEIIDWSDYRLKNSDAIIFWIDNETDNLPLIYLGHFLNSYKDIFIGIDSSLDTSLHYYIHLQRPTLSIAPTIKELALQINNCFM